VQLTGLRTRTLLGIVITPVVTLESLRVRAIVIRIVVIRIAGAGIQEVLGNDHYAVGDVNSRFACVVWRLEPLLLLVFRLVQGWCGNEVIG
jgi:hypothetical protein